MRKAKGFTLIELLVVIAIIALLMAILMPSLQRIKKQARAVACQSNLHEWGTVFSMYTTDNNNQFCSGYGAEGTGGVWMDVLRPYYKNPKLMVCPMATKPTSEGARGAFAAWGVFGVGHDPGDPYSNQPEGYYGGYGINEWLHTPPAGEVVHGRTTKENWRSANLKGGNNIPVFMDGWWWDGWPREVDEPPEYDWQRERSTSNNMRRFCINRHSGTVNGLFVDWSVRKIGLKELWTLKWHGEFDTAGPWTKAGSVQPSDWPQWMRGFKDY